MAWVRWSAPAHALAAALAQRHSAPPAPSPNSRSFATVHRTAQDSARAHLHEEAASGGIDGSALAHLGMKGDRLPAPPAGLAPRSAEPEYVGPHEFE
ncbi:hypothetical protein ABTY98_38385 [Streptomyces sp. NPDC096040]|uniref:hypothetical protein n=1 Tax=Streptomyces sp. NPDC096040 TaxID=3155541 RepID=UPI0033238B1C